jgi:hypothetical protein
MNLRERKLALALLGVLALLAGGFLLYQLYLAPLNASYDEIAGLKEQISRREEEIDAINKKKSQLDLWRKLSLPRDVDFARLEYDKYLDGLVRSCKFSEDTIVSSSARQQAAASRGPVLKNKQPVYTRIDCGVLGRATLANLVSFLERFHRTPLLHRIKKMTIRRPATSTPGQERDELNVDLTIEALVLEGAENRKTLMPSENVQKEILAKSSRNYAAIAGKNIFLGPADRPELPEPIEVTEWVKLTDISESGGRWEAFLFDVYNNRNTRLRLDRGFDTFRILDDEGEYVVRGKLERLDNSRELIFSEDGKYYRMHVGQSLAEALGRNRRNALSESEVKALGLGGARKN